MRPSLTDAAQEEKRQAYERVPAWERRRESKRSAYTRCAGKECAQRRMQRKAGNLAMSNPVCAYCGQVKEVPALRQIGEGMVEEEMLCSQCDMGDHPDNPFVEWDEEDDDFTDYEGEDYDDFDDDQGDSLAEERD